MCVSRKLGQKQGLWELKGALASQVAVLGMLIHCCLKATVKVGPETSDRASAPVPTSLGVVIEGRSP